MSTRALTRSTGMLPSVFDDFFKPWNEWVGDGGFPGTGLTVPAVNITENETGFKVAVAAPGLKKEGFKIDVDGNMLTISAKTEEQKEEKKEQYTRKEYNYSSFSRSFTVPDEVQKDKIEAVYENGVLTLMLPKKEGFKHAEERKQINVK